jgi:hypothetical protein
MGRWARGYEISCYAGGCRNLAEWKVSSDTRRGSGWGRHSRHDETRATWVFCGLHVQSSVQLLIDRKQCVKPELEPFQDAGARPPRKRKHSRTQIPLSRVRDS